MRRKLIHTRRVLAPTQQGGTWHWIHLKRFLAPRAARNASRTYGGAKTCREHTLVDVSSGMRENITGSRVVDISHGPEILYHSPVCARSFCSFFLMNSRWSLIFDCGRKVVIIPLSTKLFGISFLEQSGAIFPTRVLTGSYAHY